MGRPSTVLLAIYIVGLLVCVQQAAYWNSESEDLGLGWLDKPDDDRNWEGDELVAHQEADRKRTVWISAAVVWGVGGALVLYWVRRREALPERYAA
jgi:hypothetical protein